MTELGRLNNLTIIKEFDFGIYLDGKELGEVLLPGKLIPENCSIGDNIEVFLYADSEDRIIATTETPYAMVGQFACLKVVSIDSNGAFLYWGLLKDILVPYSEQAEKMKEGSCYIVYIYLDRKSPRIVASSKIDKFLNRKPAEYKETDEVDLFICSETDIGYCAIINNAHFGMLYKNEVFQSLKTGEMLKGYIKKIREDKKIDLSLHKPGFKKIDILAEEILRELQRKGGFIPVTDKSPPENIYKLFKASKKSFKKAIGVLYKKRLIYILHNGIRIKSKLTTTLKQDSC